MEPDIHAGRQAQNGSRPCEGGQPPARGNATPLAGNHRAMADYACGHLWCYAGPDDGPPQSESHSGRLRSVGESSGYGALYQGLCCGGTRLGSVALRNPGEWLALSDCPASYGEDMA